jgi:hypothetical protein
MTAGPIWVFVGPSLPPSARPASNDFVWRPPAMAGDALEAIEAGPRAVVLLDGLFDLYPAIRHKELLALMAEGVPVIGGASMGALRAAELHPFGMIGVGAIFQAYVSGRLVGDDEVALLHGPQEMDWAALTVPLVNVRATLVRAVRERVLATEAARGLRAVATGVFFQDRTWATVIDAARDELPAEAIERFAAWVQTGYVDLKRRDALACLAVASALPAQPGQTREAPPSTVFARALVRQVSSGSRRTPASSSRR